MTTGWKGHPLLKWGVGVRGERGGGGGGRGRGGRKRGKEGVRKYGSGSFLKIVMYMCKQHCMVRSAWPAHGQHMATAWAVQVQYMYTVHVGWHMHSAMIQMHPSPCHVPPLPHNSLSLPYLFPASGLLERTLPDLSTSLALWKANEVTCSSVGMTLSPPHPGTPPAVDDTETHTTLPTCTPVVCRIQPQCIRMCVPGLVPLHPT